MLSTAYCFRLTAVTLSQDLEYLSDGELVSLNAVARGKMKKMIDMVKVIPTHILHYSVFVTRQNPQGAPQSLAPSVPQSPATTGHHAGAVRLSLNQRRYLD